MAWLDMWFHSVVIVCDQLSGKLGKSCGFTLYLLCIISLQSCLVCHVASLSIYYTLLAYWHDWYICGFTLYLLCIISLLACLVYMWLHSLFIMHNQPTGMSGIHVASLFIYYTLLACWHLWCAMWLHSRIIMYCSCYGLWIICGWMGTVAFLPLIHMNCAANCRFIDELTPMLKLSFISIMSLLAPIGIVANLHCSN